MKMIFTTILAVLTFSSFAGGNVHSSKSPYEKTFYPWTAWMPDLQYQAELRESHAWQKFLQDHGDWWVLFNEENRKPHRATGTPIQVSGATPELAARNFISNYLQNFKIPENELVLTGVTTTEKYHYVNFGQVHNGLKVLQSKLTVRLTPGNKVVLFGADVYHDINISTSPSLNTNAAQTAAMSGINETILSADVASELFILPVPENKAYIYKLVYQVNVKTIDADMIPSDFYTLIDAVTGDVVYRQNMVKHFSHKEEGKKQPGGTIDAQVNGTVYLTHSYDPSSVQPMPNMNLSIGASNYVTDGTGFVATTNMGPATVNFELAGLWSTVETNGVMPTMSATLNGGANIVSFDTDANIRELSAFYHVNIVHDHHKSYMPTFTGMDFSLPTNVDVAGTCNAFYDGSSINFYAQGGGCTSFATVADVVYHEYGHGINDNYYSDQGSFFINGAMGEGYADFWAYSITENAVLGYGTDAAVVTDFIRRYDENRKVYPIHIVGEVHADGEIIAGAWWDTYLNLGSDMNATTLLFVEAYAGLQATAMNGNEGTAFTDVLIDALLADDIDANILNGTPNGQQIVDAFDLHGIHLISNATLAHNPVLTSAGAANIPVNATLNLNFPYTNYLSAVKCFYRLNSSPTWNNLPMTNVSGNNYTVDLPAQPNGTVIAYYVGAEDINGFLSAVIPRGADQPDPNLPHYCMVGYDLEGTDDGSDFFQDFGNWTTGLPSDNNTTGDWTFGIPTGSYSDVGPPIDTSTCVQPYYQHTPGGSFCWFTGNAPNANDGLGTNDVDAGHTTLVSPVIDMTAYTNPTITYFRWYTNNPPSGANPNADWWQVYISNNGSTWVPVENTKSSELEWRRMAFRVADYVTPTTTVSVKFIASDSTRLGQNLDGGSLIEAAVDDFQLWDNTITSVDELMENVALLTMYPNPAADMIVLNFEAAENSVWNAEVFDVAGKLVKTVALQVNKGQNNTTVSIRDLDAGSYTVRVSAGNTSMSRPLVIVR